MKIPITFKEYVAERLSMFVTDDEGGSYSPKTIFNHLNDFIGDVSKEELIQWAQDYADTNCND